MWTDRDGNEECRFKTAIRQGNRARDARYAARHAAYGRQATSAARHDRVNSGRLRFLDLPTRERPAQLQGHHERESLMPCCASSFSQEGTRPGSAGSHRRACIVLHGVFINRTLMPPPGAVEIAS